MRWLRDEKMVLRRVIRSLPLLVHTWLLLLLEVCVVRVVVNRKIRVLRQVRQPRTGASSHGVRGGLSSGVECI